MAIRNGYSVDVQTGAIRKLPGAEANTVVDQVGQPLTGSPTTTLEAINQFDALLQLLASGGTPEQQAISQARQEEITSTRNQRQQYSKEAAQADAQNLVNKAIADALRTARPEITRAAEGAGASKSSQRALLTQEAAIRGALEGAAQGTALSTSYGQVSNQLSAILENLTRQDPNSPVQLLAQSISGSRGLIKPADPITYSSSSRSAQNQQPQVAYQQPAAPEQPIASLNEFYDPGYLYNAEPRAPAYEPSSQAGTMIITRHDPLSVADESNYVLDFANDPYADYEF